jgi:hypothetical protein
MIVKKVFETNSQHNPALSICYSGDPGRFVYGSGRRPARIHIQLLNALRSFQDAVAPQLQLQGGNTFKRVSHNLSLDQTAV